jgi:hypothetical protein
MLRKRPLQKCVVIGLTAAAIAPGVAAAQTANVLVPPITSSTTPSKDVIANVLVPPVTSSTTPSEDVTANVLVPPASLAPAPAPRAAAAKARTSEQLVPPARLGRANPASDDAGFDASMIAGLGGLALIAVLGAGSSFRIRVRSPRPAMA